MLATSRNIIFLGHNHLLTTGTDDPSFAGARAIIKVSDHQHQWLAGGYDLEIEHPMAQCVARRAPMQQCVMVVGSRPVLVIA